MEPGPDIDATTDHILTDIHELLRRFDAFEKRFDAKVAEWEGIARPLTRLRDAGRLRGLGRGRDAVPQDRPR